MSSHINMTDPKPPPFLPEISYPSSPSLLSSLSVSSISSLSSSMESQSPNSSLLDLLEETGNKRRNPSALDHYDSKIGSCLQTIWKRQRRDEEIKGIEHGLEKVCCREEWTSPSLSLSLPLSPSLPFSTIIIIIKCLTFFSSSMNLNSHYLNLPFLPFSFLVFLITPYHFNLPSFCWNIDSTGWSYQI